MVFGFDLVKMAKGEAKHLDLNHNGIPDLQEAERYLRAKEVEAENVVHQIEPLIGRISAADVAADLAKFQTFSKFEQAHINAFANGIVVGLHLIFAIPTAMKRVADLMEMISK